MYVCERCGKRKIIWNGIGKGFPVMYNLLVNEIRDGKYGKEIQELYSSNDQMKIDASKVIYYCKSCKEWEEDYNFDLYLPKEETNKIHNLCWTVDEVNSNERDMNEEYVAPWDLYKNYKLFKRHEKSCLKCNQSYEKIQADPMGLDGEIFDSSKYTVKCKECGSIMSYHKNAIMVD